MKKAFILAVPAIVALALASGTTLLTGCGGGSGGGTGGGSGGGTGGGSGDPNFTCDANPNAETAQTVFTKIVQPQCLSCHVANQQGYPYGDYTTANVFFTTNVGQASILAPSLKKVAPNDLASSTLWVKLVCAANTVACKSPNMTSVGAAMPYQTGMQLSATDLKVVKDWICRGAPQN